MHVMAPFLDLLHRARRNAAAEKVWQQKISEVTSIGMSYSNTYDTAAIDI